uniref:Uncharacterized protein n=1 Tax=uncultured bacterium A1Q1_fos_1231 TaxID=1256544 RepID=L7VQ85_9BACT|nr:hypothetical protein [uncultured bacterium A1Q1_fos_1231]
MDLPKQQQAMYQARAFGTTSRRQGTSFLSPTRAPWIHEMS